MNELPVSSSRRAEILLALQRAIDARTTSPAPPPPPAPNSPRPWPSQPRPVRTGWSRSGTPPRQCRAVAGTGDDPQVRSDVLQRRPARRRRPGVHIACSSAQQLAWIKQYYPDLFDKITEKVRVGQFVPVGGMWVESDTNITGGEAMARQFVAGKSFFLENFGVETDEVWLPDSFGYSAACPRSCGPRARAGSSPRRFPGTRSTPCRTTPSRGRASMAVEGARTSHLPTRTTRWSRVRRWPGQSGSTGRRGEAAPR
jgi:alpha-mannosidase